MREKKADCQSDDVNQSSIRIASRENLTISALATLINIDKVVKSENSMAK